MPISLRLGSEIEGRLDRLAKETHRTKSFYVREAIRMHLERLENENGGVRPVKAKRNPKPKK